MLTLQVSAVVGFLQIKIPLQFHIGLVIVWLKHFKVVRMMDELWRGEGLDLKMLSYTCLATGKQVGLIQVVIDQSLHYDTNYAWNLIFIVSILV